MKTNEVVFGIRVFYPVKLPQGAEIRWMKALIKK